MATSAQNFSGLLGDIFGGGGGATGLEDYLTPAQTEQMNRQALLQAAIAASQASAPSTVPRSFMQILGAGLAGGQQGYAQAQQGAMAQLLTRQKLDEAKRAQQAQLAYQNLLTGQPTVGAEITPEQAISAPGMALGPTVQRAAMIGQPAPSVAPSGMSNLTREQRVMLSALPAEKGIPEMIKLMQPPKTTGQAFKGADGKFYIQTETGGVIPAPVAPADLGAEKFGTPVPMLMDGKTVMVQFNDKGESRIATGAMPYEPQSQDIRGFEYITGRPLAGTGPAGVQAVGEYRQQTAPRTTVTVPVDMTGGQKGFENEMKLGGAFKNEPIYKEFNDMKAAYSQVVSSLAQGTPIGDVAGATKIMKLLDPGSVVRESELGIAMAASGRMDRLQNYFKNWASGEKLTPTQREDFKQLSAELYAAAGQAYNQKRGEYKDFGGAYGFKNLDTALGEEAKLPSIVRKQPGGDAKRKPMADIFKRTP
jgi:hypothetical protein